MFEVVKCRSRRPTLDAGVALIFPVRGGSIAALGGRSDLFVGAQIEFVGKTVAKMPQFTLSYMEEHKFAQSNRFFIARGVGEFGETAVHLYRTRFAKCALVNAPRGPSRWRRLERQDRPGRAWSSEAARVLGV